MSPDAPTQWYRSRSGRLLPVSEQVSAGGIAVKMVGEVPSAAVLWRKGRGDRQQWLLPKGHVEAGESAAQAAVREVYEETGLSVRVVCFLSTMDYWFSTPTQRIHKVVHHFLLDPVAGELAASNTANSGANGAQRGTEQVQAQWVALRDLARRLDYPSERRIARIAQELLQVRGR